MFELKYFIVIYVIEFKYLLSSNRLDLSWLKNWLSLWQASFKDSLRESGARRATLSFT